MQLVQDSEYRERKEKEKINILSSLGSVPLLATSPNLAYHLGKTDSTGKYGVVVVLLD